MHALIVGAGNTGQHLAETLADSGHTVVLVERRADVAKRLSTEARLRVVEGDAADPRVLEQAGVLRADVVVAVTGDDEDNLVVCSLAKREYRVPRTVARVNNPKNAWMYGPDFGVDVAISQSDILAHLIAAEVTVGEVTTLLRLHEADVSLVEETIATESPIVGLTVRDLNLPVGAAPVAIVRGRRVIVPTSDARLEAGDRLMILAQSGTERMVADSLT